MEYRKLGKTGLSVSAIALGCEGFMGKDEKQVCDEMDFAISRGINFIDMYSSNPGLRSHIGRALEGRREKFRGICALPGKMTNTCVPGI